MADKYILSGAIKIASGPAAIGVPVFSLFPSNSYYVANSDNNFCIQNISVIDGFFDKIKTINAADCEMIEYCLGDAMPIIFWAQYQINIICGDSIDELIIKLSDDKYENIDIIDEIKTDLLSSKSANGGTIAHHFDDVFEVYDDRIRPIGAKLWLDEAIYQVNSRNIKAVEPSIEIENGVKMSLMAWSEDVSATVTTPIFKHFLWTIRQVESSGISTEEIHAAAILQRSGSNMDENVKSINLFHDFRCRFGHGPLVSLQRLSHAGAGRFRTAGRNILEGFHAKIKKAIEESEFYELLVLTFAADSVADIPDDIVKIIKSTRARKSDIIIRKRTERDAIVEYIKSETKKRPTYFDVTDQYRLVEKLEIEMRDISHEIDLINKILHDGEDYTDPIARFK